MLGTVLVLSIFLISVHATGEFLILHSPPAIEFKGNERLDTDAIGDVIAASLGYSVQDTTRWSGLYVKDPFGVAETSVTILINGIEHMHFNEKAKRYPLSGYTASESLDLLTSTMEESNSMVVDLDLSQGSAALLTYADVFDNIKVPNSFKLNGNLKPDLHSEDKLFLQQISILNSLADKLSSFKKQPTLLTIRLSLTPIVETHGIGSPATIQAFKLLAEAIEKFEKASEQTFHEDSLFVVIVDKGELSRSKRDTEKTVDVTTLNLATYYSEDYPVIFNIMLWFGVIFAFSLLAISYAIATMDPGRDSIIYRMTSTRMKKDN